MKKINNFYTRVGTNPFHYFKNFMDYINIYSFNEKLTYDKNNFQIKWQDQVVIKFNSESTMRQNIDCWEDFGFVKNIDNQSYLIKIVDPFQSDEDAFNELKCNLLKKSNDKSISSRRNAILLRMKILNNDSQITDYDNYYSSNKNDVKVCAETIKKDIGEMEKKLSDDKEFKEIVNNLEFESLLKENKND